MREAIEGREATDMKEAIEGREATDMKEAIEGKGETDGVTEGREATEVTEVTEEREATEGRGETDGVTEGREEMRAKEARVETGIQSPGGLVGEGGGGDLAREMRDEWEGWIVTDQKGSDEEEEGEDQVSGSLH